MGVCVCVCACVSVWSGDNFFFGRGVVLRGKCVRVFYDRQTDYSFARLLFSVIVNWLVKV